MAPIDEKPLIQAIERQIGYIKCSNGKVMKAFKSTYKRNGTLNLFASLDVLTGKVKGKNTETKKREDFLEFLDEVVSESPKGKELHVILDNYCNHKKNDEWLKNNPNVYFHYTPTSASWLNQVEIWFGILSRKTLKDGSFHSTEELGEAIKAFIERHNKEALPFKWRKREVNGSQIKNTIANLRN